MLSHDRIWAAIDAWPRDIHCRLPASPSGPGSTRPRSTSRSGCRPTAASAGRRPRALSKMLQGDGRLARRVPGPRRRPDGGPGAAQRAARGKVPLLGLAQAGAGGFFDDGGFPAGQGWDQVELPSRATKGLMRCRSGRFDAAALPRRRHHHRRADRHAPSRRPRRRQDPRAAK